MSYEIIKAQLDKNIEIIKCICQTNLQDMPDERFNWIYENNPYGKPECWLARNVEQNIFIGTTALFPRGMMTQGKIRKAGIAGDFAINKSHRALGPALSLQKKAFSSCRNNNIDFLYGIPNKQAEPVMVRAGYKIIGSNAWMNKPIKTYNYLKRYIKSRLLLKMLSRPFDVIIRLLSKESYYKKQGSYSFETLKSFDNRFDELWNKVSEKHTIIGERKSNYLNWKYINNPYKVFDIFAIVKKETKEILGFIVSHTSENRVEIVDMLTLDLKDTFDSLMTEFIRYHRNKGLEAVSIIYFGNEDIVMKLKQYRFFITNTEEKVIAYADPDSPLISCIMNKSNWYLLKGDQDV